MTTDKIIDQILLQVAQGEVCSGEMCEECLFCGAQDTGYFEYAIKVNDYYERVKHKSDCAILLARKVLREQGTPLNIYLLSAEIFEIIPPKRKRGEWFPVTGFRLDISAQAAINSFVRGFPIIRNTTAEFVAELPEYEVQS